MDKGVINRLAFGNPAYLGDLYDARRDGYCNSSIFFRSAPPHVVNSRDLPSTDVFITTGNDPFRDILSKMEVDLEQHASILAGLSQLNGPWREWAAHAASTDSRNVSLLYEIQTKGEYLNFVDDSIRNCIDLGRIRDGNATHVVIGRCLGGNTVLSCNYEYSANTDQKGVEDELSAQMKNLSMSILHGVRDGLSRQVNPSAVPYSVKMFGDILPDPGSLPTTLDGALQLMKQLPSIIANYDGGKGAPTSYQMIPISLFLGYQKLPCEVPTGFRGLQKERLLAVVEALSGVRESYQLLGEYEALQAQAGGGGGNQVRISKLKMQITSEERSFLSQLATILEGARSGQMNLGELDTFVRLLQSSPASSSNVRYVVNSWGDPVPTQPPPVTSAASGPRQMWNTRTVPNTSKGSYPPIPPKAGTFQRPAAFAGVNLTPPIPPKIPSPISPESVGPSSFKQNMQSIHEKLGQRASTTHSTPKQRPLPPKPPQPPPKRPTSHISSPTTPTSPPHLASSSQDLNILILGETGVGKSTWINSFINFFKYESFQDAEAGPLHSIIPSQFSVCDFNYTHHTITTGSDDNEIQQTGQSATQESRIYQLSIGNKTVRLIDTPGIGDTRGIDQDKLNFQNILNTLSNLEEVHGICILLKPNNSRLSVMFRFCIKELLTYLHRDAAKNIVFCFTNTRGTSYRPGETMPPLLKLLEENKDVSIPATKETVYCFDNEAFRYLAAVKNNPPVPFSPGDRDHFKQSWDISHKETQRMLQHIQRVPPHPIQNMLNLNYFRELVQKMCRPLAEINRNIQTNRMILEEERKAIEMTRESIGDLEKMKMTMIMDVKMVKLEHPKTVCGHESCTRIVNVDGLQKVEYLSICHPKCHQKGIPADTLGHMKLLKCSRISKKTACCTVCGHLYSHHLHVYYDSEQVAKYVENQAVRESLEQNLTAAEMKQRMIDEKNGLLQGFQEELKVVENASIRFAHFLKANAIVQYNDGLEPYLDHLIKEEEDKVACGMNRNTLDSLRRSRDSYKHEKSILERQMEQGLGRPPTTQEVDGIVRGLKGLKHSGRILEDALNCISYAGSREQAEPADDGSQTTHLLRDPSMRGWRNVFG